MLLADLAGARVALLGMGRDVSAALPAVVAAGPSHLMVVDDLLAPGSVVEAGEGMDPLPVVGLAEAAATADVLVRSPGFPRYSPELTSALGRGARMTTPLDLWLGGLATSRTVVAVTGTKGKSTTASMVAALAEDVGIEAVLAGNIGTPVFDPGWDSGAEVVVLEVSSYQAADLHHPPHVAVVTSLAEDHVDWHGSARRYLDDKMRVLANEGGTASVAFVASASAASLPQLDGCDVMLIEPAGEIDPQVPPHVAANAALAAAVVSHLSGKRLGASEALAVAPNLPSRLEVVAVVDEVTWVDDALGSNPSATAAGLAWVRAQGRDVIVLLGGAERGVDVAPLRREAAAWEGGALQVIGLPDNGAALAARAGLELVAEAPTVTDAASVGASLARPGSVVLLSPAAPTPKRQGTWRERSGEFRAAVERLADGGLDRRED